MRRLVRGLPLLTGVALGVASCAGTTAGSDEPTVELVIHDPSRHGMSACYYRYDPDC